MANSVLSQRVFLNSTDLSTIMADYRQGSYVVPYTLTDKIYIGTSMPMTNMFLNLSVPSTSSAGTPIIKVWYGQAWTNVVDILDGTAGMTKSGRMSWSLQMEKGWDIEQKSEDVTGLSNDYIYNLYWLELSWPANFTASISFIGQKFSDDLNLATFYPDLVMPAMLDAFKQGKTNWDEQHFMAAEAIVRDLRARNIAKERFQILDASVFTPASVYKVAELAYSAYGQAYRDRADLARKYYNEEMSKRLMSIDENADGFDSPMEKTLSQGWITR